VSVLSNILWYLLCQFSILCRCTWVHVFNFFFLCEFALFTIIILLYICCLLLQSNCLRVLIQSWNLEEKICYHRHDWWMIQGSKLVCHVTSLCKWRSAFEQLPVFWKLMKCCFPSYGMIWNTHTVSKPNNTLIIEVLHRRI
jgi:hypothetical protein